MSEPIIADVGASVWKILASVGDVVDDGGVVMILESMKMEIPVICEGGGTIASIDVAEAQTVAAGQLLATVN
ncbi:biotin/lipoyl-binding carrier protein [Nocardia sp. NPDC127606]|uniref:biotin/lipoyl-binding carrier protein n=1 Tax=Nocardia sp. NPDC127606 TaxID=3345406 RepID=UPI003629FE7C